MGTENITTVQCDQTNNVCAIKVPAPGFALVFLNDDAFTENDGGPSTTFPTTAQTKTINTVTVDPAVLSTSNGHSGMGAQLGSTSHGSISAASSLTQALPGLVVVAALVSGAFVVGRALVR